MTILGTIAAVVTAFGLNATNLLVNERGAIAASYSITNASATTPIRVTLATAHDFAVPFLPGTPPNVAATPGAHVAISGLTAPTAADGVFVALVVDAMNLDLYSLNYATGALEPVIGVGTYVGGGTLQTAFRDGRALLGNQHVTENSSPPRVTFVPVLSEFLPRRETSTATRLAPGATPPDVAGYRAAALTRAIWNESLRFNVHIWGAANPPDPELGDFDATRTLYTTVIQAIHQTTVGNYKLQSSPWPDQRAAETNIDKLGTQIILGVSVEMPVLDSSLVFVPGGTQAQVTLNFAGASPSDAITFEAGSA